MFQMSAGQKYRRTNFEEDDVGSASGDVTPPGITYSPVVAFGGQMTFCQRRSASEKILLSVVIVLTVIVFTLIIVLGSHRHAQDVPNVDLHNKEGERSDNKSNSAGVSENLCLSKSCITVASSILNSMDTSVDPCEDFYQFACGNWIKSHPIPPGESRWDTFGVLRRQNEIVMKNLLETPLNETRSLAEQMAKTYYTSCLDKNGTIEEKDSGPLEELIGWLGGWSVDNISAVFNLSQWNLQKTMEKLHGFGLHCFFAVWVSDDEKDPTRNIIQLDQGGLTLQRDQYLNKTIRDDRILTAYLKFMTDIGILLGGSKEETRRLMINVIEFERNIANMTTPLQDRRDNEKLYHKKDIKLLQQLAPFLNWTKYFTSLFSVTSYHISENQPVIIRAPDFFSQLSNLVTRLQRSPEGKITLQNYMVWHLIKSTCSCLSRPFREAKKEFYKVLYGTTGDEERWRSCVSDTESVLGFALSALFVRKTFKEQSKQAADNMIEHIKYAFKSNLPKLSWMQSDTQRAAAEKVDAVMNMIGFPEYILNQTELDKRYEELSISGDEYFVNNINSMKYIMKRNLEKIQNPPDKKNWNMAPSVVNAYYSPTKNQIVFPAGILQAPFFDKEIPHSINFGAIGVVMGHELTHGFDDQGREYDKNGVLGPWWSESSVQKFKDRVQCMINQYSNFSDFGENIRGKQTLGENIADNGGLKAAYYAYKNLTRSGGRVIHLPGLNLTQEQLFFLSFAQVWCTNSSPEDYHMSILSDVHSPNKFRVIGPLSNSREFAAEFNCATNSRMNPSRKCEVW